MYCPKCGGQNSDDLAYCRDCGENLKIISQVMKGHASVALVSKIDAVFEQKYERIRRDSVLSAIVGVVLPISAAQHFSSFGVNWLGGFIGITGVLTLISSIYLYLTYLRSLKLRTTRSAAPGVPMPDTRSLPETTTDKLRKDDESQSEANYCPRCGISNASTALKCVDCLCSLDYSPVSIDGGFEKYLYKSMDRTITSYEKQAIRKPILKSGWTVVLGSLGFMPYSISRFVEGDWGWLLFSGVLGFASLVSNGWDLIAFRRTTALDLTAPESRDSKTGELAVHNTSDFGLFMHEMKNLPVGDEPMSFDAQDTRPLDAERPSVIEETTKPLNRESEGEIPKTLKLGSQDE